MSEQTFKVKGMVLEIGDLIHTKKENNPDLYKKTLTIKTADGQKLYVDVINKRLKSLEKEDISEGVIVDLEISFKGSERDNKKYNNIYCNSIIRA